MMEDLEQLKVLENGHRMKVGHLLQRCFLSDFDAQGNLKSWLLPHLGRYLPAVPCGVHCAAVLLLRLLCCAGGGG